MGFAYLKLGQFDDAIADYNAALRANAKMAGSLFGRGVAELRKGDANAGNADIAATKEIKVTIADDMKSFGIVP